MPEWDCHDEIPKETALIMRLLAAYDRETYGETKVIELDIKNWDGTTRS